MQTQSISRHSKSNPEKSPINIREVTEICLEAHRVCTQTISHCLAEGGLHSDVKHIRLLLECAEACSLNSNFLMRGSELYRASCAFCAEVAEKCAIEAGKFNNDVFMQKCTDVCLRCAIACRQMQKKK